MSSRSEKAFVSEDFKQHDDSFEVVDESVSCDRDVVLATVYGTQVEYEVRRCRPL